MKVCGHRSPQEVAYAAGDEPRADAVGAVVASPDSPRNLPPDRARDVLAAAPDGVRRVAVTVARTPDRLARIAEAVAPDVLQLHDGADPTTLDGLRTRFPDLDVWVATDPGEGVPDGPYDAALVDARTPDGYGGTGRTLDWDEARALRVELAPTPVILAGGLTPDNVGQAIEAVAPDGVDAASGVETDGRKDPHRVRAFIARARSTEDPT